MHINDELNIEGTVNNVLKCERKFCSSLGFFATVVKESLNIHNFTQSGRLRNFIRNVICNVIPFAVKLPARSNLIAATTSVNIKKRYYQLDRGPDRSHLHSKTIGQDLDGSGQKSMTFKAICSFLRYVRIF